MNTRQCVLIQTAVGESFAPHRLRLLAPECPNIKCITLQRRPERGLIQLLIMSQGNDCRAAIRGQSWQRTFGPLRNQIARGETLRRGEGTARVDHGDLVTGEIRHRRERLRNVYGTDDEHARRWRKYLNEQGAVNSLADTTTILAQRFLRRVRGCRCKRRACRIRVRIYDSLLTGCEYGDQGGRFLVPTGRKQLGQDRALHSTGSR